MPKNSQAKKGNRYSGAGISVSPKNMNSKKFILDIIKMAKVEERILKAARERQNITTRKLPQHVSIS